jgi:hypothetical protein
VADWPEVADYLGDFKHAEGVDNGKKGLNLGMFEGLFE